MRYHLLPAALFAAAISAPAAASGNDGTNWYVGADIGIILPRDSPIDITDAGSGTSFQNAVDVQYHTGFEVAGQIGYDFLPFRVEGELGYKHASFDAVDPSSDLINYLNDNLPLGPGVVITDSDINLNDGIDVIDVMVNGLVDIGPHDGFGGYAGGGVGMGFAKAYGESNSSFAWQIIAGIRFPVAENFDLGVKYKYFDMSGLDFVEGTDVQGANFAANLDGNFREHSLLVNGTLHFR